MASAAILDNFEWPYLRNDYLYSAHRAVIFAIAQLTCWPWPWLWRHVGSLGCKNRTQSCPVSGSALCKPCYRPRLPTQVYTMCIALADNVIQLLHYSISNMNFTNCRIMLVCSLPHVNVFRLGLWRKRLDINFR